MWAALKSVGTAVLPYALQAGSQLIKQAASRYLGDTVSPYAQTLGDCVEKMVDTFGNNSAVVQELRKAQRGQLLGTKIRTTQSQTGLIDETNEAPQKKIQQNDYEAD